MTPNTLGSRRAQLAVVIAFMAFFTIEMLRTAWIAEDAYITFRVVENVLHGFGPRYNPAERVQAYTHPLWMGLLTAGHAVTGEPYYSSLVLSFLLSSAALVALGLWLARGALGAALALVVTSASRSFVDYSSSGLENPLAHLLLALFVGVFLLAPSGRRRTVALALLGSAVALDRLDHVLLVAPALATELVAGRNAATLRRIAFGLLPIAAWEMFSLVYYGFPFPNTAYAKLGAGVPASWLLQQGLWYALDVVIADPILPAAILIALAATIATREPRELALAAGMLLYIAYVVRIGGDFMGGRFFTAPLMVSAGTLARSAAFTPHRAGVALAAVVGLALLTPYPSIASGPRFGTEPRPSRRDDHGVMDARFAYYPFTGLLRLIASESPDRVDHPWAEVGRRCRAEGPSVALYPAIGLFGHAAGPDVHVVDPLALADPLLARLPAERTTAMRIGHFGRAVPAGYLDTLTMGENVIADPSIREYYGHLRTIIRGPLLTRERLVEIVRMNLGVYGTPVLAE